MEDNQKEIPESRIHVLETYQSAEKDVCIFGHLTRSTEHDHPKGKDIHNRTNIPLLDGCLECSEEKSILVEQNDVLKNWVPSATSL